MNKTILASFFFFLLATSNLIGQTISKYKAVINPKIERAMANGKIHQVGKHMTSDVKGMTIINNVLMRFYDHSNYTQFSPIVGGQVYKKNGVLINMFPYAVGKGKIESYQKKLKFVLLFLKSSKDDRGNNSLYGSKIIFIVDGNKYTKKIRKDGFVVFDNTDNFINLYTAKEVQALIESDNKFYLLDMSKEIRSVIGILLKTLMHE